MLSFPGQSGSTCDGISRREFIRVGGCGLLGLSLPSFLSLQSAVLAAETAPVVTASSFGSVQSVIFLFLQGGPSHIDIWDPKPDAPSNVRSEFKPLKTNVEGLELTEVMPMLAKQMDKATLIRSVSYTPVGLFNHTAAMYEMLTGETPDRVAPSGQLDPPAPNDYPNIGSNIAKRKPVDVPMPPFVMLPRALQESSVIGKAGTAGSLGKTYDPYYFFQDPNKDFTTDDLKLRPEVTEVRLKQCATLQKTVEEGMPLVQKAVENQALDKYYEKAYDLILSGRARRAFNITQEPSKTRDRYGRHTFGQAVLLSRRLVEAGTRFVQVNWPAVANGDPQVDAWDTHTANFGSLKDLHCPKLDSALSALLEDLDQRGLLKETLVVAIGEFGRSPRMGVSTSGNSNAPDGRDHWPYCYTALIAGGHIGRGKVYGQSDATGYLPAENPVHPRDILATIYHCLGIDPHTIVTNHLCAPRKLVDGEVIEGLFI